MPLEVGLSEAMTETDSDRWTYFRDKPAEWVDEYIQFRDDEYVTTYQRNALEQLIIRKRVSMRGPHGLGKTALMAWTILWFICCFPYDTKIPTTASAWRQLEKYLWPEVRKWAGRIDWNKWKMAGGQVPEIRRQSIVLGDTAEAFPVASDDAALIEGAHATNLLYIFDESKTVHEDTWDAAEGAFSTEGGNLLWMACSTPGNASGRFYDIHVKKAGLEDWLAIHVTKEEAIAEGRLSKEWVAKRKRQWGERSPQYQARVEGNFPKQSKDQLISYGWIEAARQRELEPEFAVVDGKITTTLVKISGVDVARQGDDDSAQFVRSGPCVLEGESWHGNDLMETTGKVKHRGVPAIIDVIGIGAGVYDRLYEQEFEVYWGHVGEAAEDTELYARKRDEWYWNLRTLFEDGLIDLTGLDEDIYDRLLGELVAIPYAYTSKGQIKIEAKKDTRKRLRHSPDLADALMLTFAPVDAGRLLMSDDEYVED